MTRYSITSATTTQVSAAGGTNLVVGENIGLIFADLSEDAVKRLIAEGCLVTQVKKAQLSDVDLTARVPSKVFIPPPIEPIVLGPVYTPSQLFEFAGYEELRSELRNLPANEKKQVLIDRFGARAAHGFFDAVSPRINDLLTFREIEELLLNLGFKNIRKTIKNRNHHIIAEKI